MIETEMLWRLTALGHLRPGATFVFPPLGKGEARKMDTWRVDEIGEVVRGAAEWSTIQMLHSDGSVRLTAVGKPGHTLVLIKSAATLADAGKPYTYGPVD